MDETSKYCQMCDKDMAFDFESKKCTKTVSMEDKIQKCLYYESMEASVGNGSEMDCQRCVDFYIPPEKVKSKSCQRNKNLYKCLEGDKLCASCEYKFGWWSIGIQAPPSLAPQNSREYQKCVYDPWTDQSVKYQEDFILWILLLGVFFLGMLFFAIFYWIKYIKNWFGEKRKHLAIHEEKEEFEKLHSFNGSRGLLSDGLKNSNHIVIEPDFKGYSKAEDEDNYLGY